jgi:hypothetical protein
MYIDDKHKQAVSVQQIRCFSKEKSRNNDHQEDVDVQRRHSEEFIRRHRHPAAVNQHEVEVGLIRTCTKNKTKDQRPKTPFVL